jgi:hypothetical protein
MRTHKDETNSISTISKTSKSELLDHILEDFFTLNSVENFKEEMWNWLIVAMSSEEFGNWTGQQRSDLAILYKDLICLVERLDKLREG